MTTRSPSPVGEATASVDVNAVGSSIDVKANADNTKDTSPVKEDGFNRNIKLSASIGVKAESNKLPEDPNKEEQKGLAIIAVQSDILPEWADYLVFDPGHAGVGIWKDDGTWTIGSLQAGPQGNPLKLGGLVVLPGFDNKGWSAHDLTWPEVVALLSSSEKEIHAIEGKKVLTRNLPSTTRPGNAYDKIKIIKVDDPKPLQANEVIDNFKNRGFWFNIIIPSLSNNCLDATIDALNAYGVKDLPSSRSPNNYLANLEPDRIVQGNEFSWNSDWNTYTNKNSPDFHPTPTPPTDEPPAPPMPSGWTVNVGELIQSYIDKAISGDTITISPGIFNENLVIDKSLTLKGAGSTESGTIVDGKDSGSVLSIGKLDPNINVNLYDMLIRNGLARYGGGIYNRGTLNVEDCIITGNTATGYGTWGGDPSGGGIYNKDGTVTITNSNIIENNAQDGGGICNANGEMSITNSVISSNSASDGAGGIFNADGEMSITKSVISSNFANNGGGGILSAGTLNLMQSTITENRNHHLGGGIAVHGEATISGCIISKNNGREGGGIYSNGAILDVIDSTISENNAYDNGGGIGNEGTTTISNSIISKNVAARNGGGIYSSSSTLSIIGTSQIINNEATNGYGGGIYSTIYSGGGLVIFDGSDSIIKFNKALSPDTLGGIPWYRQYGVYMHQGRPTMTNGFDPSTQVSGNTRILNLPEWGEVSPTG